MESSVIYQRALLFSALSSKPVLMVKGMFNKNETNFFIAYDFREYNPSNNIYYGELSRGKNIDAEIKDMVVYDQDKFLTKLETIQDVSIKLHKDSKFYVIKTR
jgi:hypothetical protein